MGMGGDINFRISHPTGIQVGNTKSNTHTSRHKVQASGVCTVLYCKLTS